MVSNEGNEGFGTWAKLELERKVHMKQNTLLLEGLQYSDELGEGGPAEDEGDSVFTKENVGRN